MALTKLQSFNLDTTANFTFSNITATNANLGNAATANYFIGSGANLTSLPGGNVSGQVGNALVAGTVYTNAQPNITSVGDLTGLTSNGVINFTNTSNVSLGSVGNIKISGGSANYVLKTDGAGNLSWTVQSGGSSGGFPCIEVTANTTATANTSYIIDTSTSNITLTLPSSPSIGARVEIIDGVGNASIHGITIGRNGEKIQGSASDMTVTTNRSAFTLVYYNAAQGWILTSI